MSSKVGDLIMGSGYIVQRGGGKDYSAFKALADRDITEVTAEMLDGVTKIGSYAFYSCTSLASITIPNSVTSIGRNAFQGCSSLPSINIPSSVTSMSYDTFRDCTSLTSVTIQSGVTSIGASVFYGCRALTSIDIPNSVTAIGTTAFSGCSALTSIDIPSGVTSIVNSAFSSCSSLTSVTVEATTPPTLGTNVFDGTHADLVIYVPAGSVDTYKAASGWSDYALRIQAIPST